MLRAQDRELTDTISKLESTEKDLIKCKQQRETSIKEIAERNNELKTAKGELAKVQSSEDELKKKVASLEEALAKANNDLGKSQVCWQCSVLFCFIPVQSLQIIPLEGGGGGVNGGMVDTLLSIWQNL